mmetsp:Transcript_1328/g.3771  ORF Transcript_1328/g.3771 Transcript_1328/m.3771 type:complete len:213 (-) Transcript_1328:393-1031(-)
MAISHLKNSATSASLGVRQVSSAPHRPSAAPSLQRARSVKTTIPAAVTTTTTTSIGPPTSPVERIMHFMIAAKVSASFPTLLSPPTSCCNDIRCAASSSWIWMSTKATATPCCSKTAQTSQPSPCTATATTFRRNRNPIWTSNCRWVARMAPTYRRCTIGSRRSATESAASTISSSFRPASIFSSTIDWDACRLRPRVSRSAMPWCTNLRPR